MPLSPGCILLYTRVCRELVWVMAIFCTSWLVAANMTPFAMTYHNWLPAAERLCESSCLCAKAVATVSRFVLLSARHFALHYGSGRLQTCCFSLFAFRLFLRLNQKPPFAPREVSRCRLLSLLQSSGLLRIVIVCSPSPFLRLNTKALRFFFCQGAQRLLLYTVRPDSELVRFAGAVLSLLGH